MKKLKKRNTANTIKIISKCILVFLLVSSWLLTSWPGMFNFPPRVKEVKAVLSAPSLLDTATSNTADTTLVSGTISPTANSLLIVATSHVGAVSSTDYTLSISDSFTGTGTWTQYTVSVEHGSRFSRVAIFVAQAGSSPGSGAITVTSSTNTIRKIITTHEVTGHNTSTPVSQSKTGTSTADTLSFTLDSTPATDSMVFGLVGSKDETNGITPGTNFTETNDVVQVATAGDRVQTQYDKDNATTTVDWSSLNTTNNRGVAIEIAAAGGGTPTFTQNTFRWYVDNDATNPTDPWSSVSGIDIAENTAITPLPTTNNPPGPTDELRLRVNFTVNTANLSATSQQFKLQFKAGTDASCTTGSWTDVGAAQTWEYATSSVTDGATITTVLTTSDVAGQYAKSSPTTTNANSATTGQDIEYDFHIVGTNIANATQYSFRAVESDGTIFDAYTNCPTLTTVPAVGNFMRHGNFFSSDIERGFFW